MEKANTIKIDYLEQSLGCRTINPENGFEIEEDNTLVLRIFKGYRSSKHNVSATTTIIENTGDKVLLKVESIDWVFGQPYPYSTQGCFLFQLTTEKYGRTHLSCDRVPCSKETIQDAIDYLTPAAVKKAKESGKKVKRQGDFFFIEMKKKSNFDALWASRHEPKETNRGISISHPEHKALLLGKGHWKAVQRKTRNHIKAD